MTYLFAQIWAGLFLMFAFGGIIGYICARLIKKKPISVPSSKAASQTPQKQPQVDDVLPLEPPHVTSLPLPPSALESDKDLSSSNYGIQCLEGIGPKTGDLFRGIGIHTVADYLLKLHSPDLREKAAYDLSVKIEPLHEWASMADLMRIRGIDSQYAELLTASGILSVTDLKKQKPEKLIQIMDQTNQAAPQQISPRIPEVQEAKSWIERAKMIKPIITV